MPIDAPPDPSIVAFEGWMQRQQVRADKQRAERAAAAGAHNEKPPVAHNLCEHEIPYIMSRARHFKAMNNDDDGGDNDVTKGYVESVKKGNLADSGVGVKVGDKKAKQVMSSTLNPRKHKQEEL